MTGSPPSPLIYIDDEQALLDLGKIFLERSGHFSVDTEVDPEKGLKRILSGEYDAVISDFQMPVLDGISLLKEIRSRGSKIPFIIFTGKGREDVVIEALNSGADFYLQKGGDPGSQFAELAKKVEHAIARRRAEEELLRKNEELAAAEEELRVQLDDLIATQNDLRQSRDLFRTFIDHSYDAIFIHDQTGRVLDVNETMLTMYRITREEALRFTIEDYSGSSYDTDEIQVLWNSVLAGEDQLFPWVARRPLDDTLFDVEVFLTRAEMNGEFYILAFIRDMGDRKTAEREAADTREWLTRIIDTLPDPTFVVDAGGVVTAWNQAIEEMTGVSADEMIGKGDYAYAIPFYGKRRPVLIDIARGEDGDTSTYSIIRQEKGVIEAETETALPRGGRTVLWARAVPLLDGHGKCAGAIETIRDITVIHEERAKLRENREKYQNLVENLTEIVYTLDTEGRITYVSPNVKNRTGLRGTELIGRSIFDFVALDDRERQHEQFQRVLAGEEIVAEFPATGMDAGTRWMRTTARPEIEDGAVTRVHGILIDITDLKQVEEALRESEEMYRSLIENLSEIVYTLDTDGRITYISPNVEALGGYPPEALLGRQFTDFVHPDDVSERMPQFGKVLSGSGETTEYRLIGVDGRVAWMRTAAQPLIRDGEVVGVAGLLADITDRRNAEDEIRLHLGRTEVLLGLYQKSDATIRELTAYALDGARRMTESEYSFVALLSPDASLLSIHAWSEEVLADCRIAASPVEFSVHESGLLGEAVRTGKPVLVNDYSSGHPASHGYPKGHVPISRFLSVPISDGARIRALLAVANKEGAYTDDDLNALMTLGNMLSGIIERKKTEHALQESEERFRRLSENAGDIIYRIDLLPAPCFTYVNPMIQVITGYGPEEFYADPGLLQAIIHPEDNFSRNELLNRLGELIVTRLVRRDGEVIWVEQKNVPVYDADGNLVAIEGIARDITAAKKNEEKLAWNAAAIADANRKLNLMTGITRHDIANQLTVLNGYLTLAGDTLKDTETLSLYLAKMEEATERIRRQIEFTREYQDLGVAAPDWQRLSGVIGEHGTARIPVVDETDAISIFADPLLPKVFANLMENTERYAAGATRVRVWCRRDNGDLLVLWEDDGPGIPAEEKEQIFLRGYGKNTGLGLFFIREILGITGITITEDGVPGDGARFVIRVPEGGWRRG
ncbi:MAG: PAS domain S-box protein [Methanocalculus sp. MSAO_Arc1]|uniref:PAS domain S-box protein n=1 Tax=Methanocalculus TaxID=71151 RepID=UPI000FF5A783|nr:MULTISPECIES: PAS domain S-box protein [unclassified Methanocalculus]MCP1661533.1 PAS domain S-box-containing protein [Methanocalculus sp. AMF5]RQD81015.1 MAG: PAS domain S-box protein [Methanocalculus sp. MSAO_Arc1]